LNRYLIAINTGDTSIHYDSHQIVDGYDEGEALDKYNTKHDICGTVIARVDPNTRIQIRSGPIDSKMMLKLHQNDALIPVYDKK